VVSYKRTDEHDFIQGAITALHFILTSAAKHDVDELSLVQEIQQLGLPQSNANIIGREYSSSKAALQDRLSADTYRLSRVIDTKWRIDVDALPEKGKAPELFTYMSLLLERPRSESTTMASDQCGSQEKVSDHYLSNTETVNFALSSDKLDLLILELTQARSALKKV
jgi:hypothetical protein